VVDHWGTGGFPNGNFRRKVSASKKEQVEPKASWFS